MKVNPIVLKQLTQNFLGRLRTIPRQEFCKMLHMVDYHGFSKARLPVSLFQDFLNQYRVNSRDIQIEVVQVTTDLRHEIHYHKKAFAYIVCLGEDVGLENPCTASAFLCDRWVSLTCGQELEIPPGIPHGFTVKQDGSLHFLSLQSPPILGEDGHDDYFLVTNL